MLAAAGDVLPLLIGQLVSRVHGLFLAGVEEARTVGQEDASGQRLKHPPQGIAGRQRASCTDNYIGKPPFKKGVKQAVLRIRFRDPVPFRPLDPGSGMGKKSGSGSGINNPDHISSW
jgi:hypothetical protein